MVVGKTPVAFINPDVFEERVKRPVDRVDEPGLAVKEAFFEQVDTEEPPDAVQHAEEYSPLKLRSAIIPITNIGSSLSIPIFFIGLLFNYTLLMNIGILLFGLVALFQLITLPVEFNASRRALATIEERALLTEDEARGAKKVLSAAALTYVAALASTLAQLLRLIIISRGNRRN